MEPRDYLRALRRRPAFVVAAIVIALATAWVTSRLVPQETPPVSYEATAVLLGVGPPAGFSETPPGSITSTATVAALTTLGPIPERVAEDLGYQGDPEDLAARVSTSVDKQSGLLSIIAISGEPQEAKALADSFSEQLLKYLKDRQQRGIASETQFISGQLDQLQKSIDRLSDRGEGAAGRLNERILERDALRDRRQSLFGTVSSAGWEIVEEPTPLQLATTETQASGSLIFRLAIALVLGLLAGIGTVLVIDRIDTRIRTKDDAEERFGKPVLAEIPRLRRRERRSIAAASNPKSAPAEAFRLLGTELARGVYGPGDEVGSGNGSSPPVAPKTILVTSPGPGDGKTTVVANLAAALAEMGKRVLIVSCDFRRPAIHRLFDLSNDTGLSDAIRSSNGSPVLGAVIKQTGVPGIWAVPSGKAPSSPSQLLASANMRRVLAEARDAADVILIDTAPILAVSDAALLLQDVDAVLIVARAGKTTAALAQHTSELFSRLGAPAIGVTLNDASETVIPRRYAEYAER